MQKRNIEIKFRLDKKEADILEPQEYTKDDGSSGVGYNVKKIFDISQVDTRRFKTEPPPNYDDRQLLAALVSNVPMRISSVDNLPDNQGAITDPDTGEITVRKGMTFPETFQSIWLLFER